MEKSHGAKGREVVLQRQTIFIFISSPLSKRVELLICFDNCCGRVTVVSLEKFNSAS